MGRAIGTALHERVHTFGQYLLRRFGEPVHKIALDAGFTCPNRDGSKGRGGCTFCNNASFSPNGRQRIADLEAQLERGRQAVASVTGARKFIAYFQAYTNTYGDVEELDALYQRALRHSDVVGISVGTRPDCVAPEVIALLAGYRAAGWEVWLELGLQSAFDATLARVNRGHGLAEYQAAVTTARAAEIPVCTHLILGLPGEGEAHFQATLDVVLDLGVDGLKLHPLHVVRGTRLAHEWRRGEYQPMRLEDYVRCACDLIERTPSSVIFHRLTGVAGPDILLAPDWCGQKWPVLNAIARELSRRGTFQGARATGSRESVHGWH